MLRNESKPKIAIDIDDVIAAENEGIRQFTNREYGTEYAPEDFLVDGEYWGYWERIWGLEGEKARERYEAFLRSPEKADLKVVEGAVEAINILKKRFEPVIVTSRDGFAIEITEPWLEKNFPTTFGQIEFLAIWKRSREATKAMICKQIGAGYLVDDNATHCNLAAEEGVTALLFGDYGWNRNVELHAEVERVRDWQAVVEYFDGES